MLYISVLLLLLSAALCFGLSRRISTRVLGFIATASTLLCGIVLSVEQLSAFVPRLPPITLIVLDQTVVSITPDLNPGNLIPAMALLYSSALALLALTLSLAATLRGFGILFGWVLLILATVLVGLGGNLLFQPLAWSMAILLCYSVVMASGSLGTRLSLPQGVTLGFLASLLLLGSLLWLEPDIINGGIPALWAIAGVVVASMMLVGGILFHNTLDEAVVAPAALGSIVYGAVLPILAFSAISQLSASLPVTAQFSLRMSLQVLGVLSMLVCAAGALREHGLRRMLGWQASSQMGLVFLAIGLQGPLAVLAAPALLVNLVVATVAGSLAVTVLERLTGSDDFTITTAVSRLWPAGVIWAIAAASALGLPPLWGFWGRRWLLNTAVLQAPWIVPLVIMASVLAALAYAGPLARFWGRTGNAPPMTPLADGQDLTALKIQDMVILALSVLPLVILGIVPHLAWRGWLAGIDGAPPALPAGALDQVAGVLLGLGGVVITIMLLRYRSARRHMSDEDMTTVVLAPDALAHSLGWLIWLGYPGGLVRRVWQGLQLLSKGVATVLSPFEHHFYLAFVLLAIFSIILLMAQ